CEGTCNEGALNELFVGQKRLLHSLLAIFCYKLVNPATILLKKSYSYATFVMTGSGISLFQQPVVIARAVGFSPKRSPSAAKGNRCSRRLLSNARRNCQYPVTYGLAAGYLLAAPGNC